jgi:hypothetical protein
MRRYYVYGQNSSCGTVAFLGRVPEDADAMAARALAVMHKYSDGKNFRMHETNHDEFSIWRVRKDRVYNVEAYRRRHVSHMLWVLKHVDQPLPVAPLVSAASRLLP